LLYETLLLRTATFFHSRKIARKRLTVGLLHETNVQQPQILCKKHEIVALEVYIKNPPAFAVGSMSSHPVLLLAVLTEESHDKPREHQPAPLCILLQPSL